MVPGSFALVCDWNGRRRDCHRGSGSRTKRFLALRHVREQRLWSRTDRCGRLSRACGSRPSRQCGRAVGGREPGAPLLRNPRAGCAAPAITTYLHNNHAIRTERCRYIRYRDGFEELYDHQADPHECTNLAKEPKYASTMAELAKWLPKVRGLLAAGGRQHVVAFFAQGPARHVVNGGVVIHHQHRTQRRGARCGFGRWRRGHRLVLDMRRQRNGERGPGAPRTDIATHHVAERSATGGTSRGARGLLRLASNESRASRLHAPSSETRAPVGQVHPGAQRKRRARLRACSSGGDFRSHVRQAAHRFDDAARHQQHQRDHARHGDRGEGGSAPIAAAPALMASGLASRGILLAP